MANNYMHQNTSGNKAKPTGTATKPYEPLTEEGYVTRAEQVIKTLERDKSSGKLKLTTSQLRNILSMVNQLYNDVIMTTSETLSNNIQSQLQYLKVKIVYAAGRYKEVQELVQKSQIDCHIDYIKDNRKKFILYARYIEALVAYHRFYGGDI